MFSLSLERSGIPLGCLVEQPLKPATVLECSLDFRRQLLRNIETESTLVHSTEQHETRMVLTLLASRTPLSNARSSPPTQ